MARQMANKQYREQQWEQRYAPHIRPFNELVDKWRETDWMPYIAPMYGGEKARLLSLLRDPGPKTQEDKGSGFLSMENNDPTAEALFDLFTEAGISASDAMLWNAYPWYINRDPTAAELKKGVEPLKQIIDLMPELKVVMLHGQAAQNGWKHSSS